jgi:diaminopimelate epimerase
MQDIEAIPFAKMTGSGNDFVVIDNRAALIPSASASAFTRAVCRRGLSMGGDGVVLIERPEAGHDVDFSWRYLNADGSDGEMCGNGAMCAARFALHSRITGRHMRFATRAGVVEAWVGDDPAEVAIKIEDSGPIGSAIEAHGLTLYPVRVGVPHGVAFVEDADAFATRPAFEAMGRLVRHDPAFAPDGVNMNIASGRADGSWRMRTYERGVEAETLACGTGAVATALVAVLLSKTRFPVKVLTSSGRTLSVSAELEGSIGRSIRLQGHAAIIAEGTLRPDAWR